MLKEVGTSGQIPVGKKYADQLFNLVFCPDGGLEMMSIKVVPFVNEATSFQYPAQAQYPAQWVQDTALFYPEGNGWLTSECLAARQAAYARARTIQFGAGQAGELRKQTFHYRRLPQNQA